MVVMSKRVPKELNAIAVTANASFKLEPNRWYDFDISGDIKVQSEVHKGEFFDFPDTQSAGSHSFTGRTSALGRIKCVHSSNGKITVKVSKTPPVLPS